MVVKSCNKGIPTGCNRRILHKASHAAPGQGASEMVGSPSLETSRTGYILGVIIQLFQARKALPKGCRNGLLWSAVAGDDSPTHISK